MGVDRFRWLRLPACCPDEGVAEKVVARAVDALTTRVLAVSLSTDRA
jgi:hypothetical protein